LDKGDYCLKVFGISVRFACSIINISKTVYNCQPDTEKDKPVVDTLLELSERYPRNGFGKLFPIKMRMDNGLEFVSVRLSEWAEEHDVELEFIQPGKPFQNSYIERFNRNCRNEILDFYVFNSLLDMRAKTEAWIDEYNHE